MNITPTTEPRKVENDDVISGSLHRGQFALRCTACRNLFLFRLAQEPFRVGFCRECGNPTHLLFSTEAP